ncbi:MAG: methyltransferase domain-containing protein [Pyrinomonadaceae bacterium]|nr:methyltransferase domain-containing protein [Pyrinomonadaceae bacterium]
MTTQAAQQPQGELGPEQLLQMSLSFTPSRVLSSALQLDVFSHIAAGKRTADDVASAAGANARAMRMLLDALAGLQLLVKKNEGYELTPASENFLVRSSPTYLGTMMENDQIWNSWTNLTEVVRTGKPVRLVEDQRVAEDFFPMLVRSLHIMNSEPARRLAEALGAGTSSNGLRVVDVACGSGVWGIAIAEADRSARVTAQDFPGVFNVTREFVKRHNLEDRFDYLPGDLKEVDFGEERYDLAILGNIVHSEGERSSRDLFKRLHKALAPGGRIAILEMVPNDERTGPPFALLFALNMLVNTEEGGTYTLAEYTDWLKTAGFSRVETADIGSHSPAIIGIKE